MNEPWAFRSFVAVIKTSAPSWRASSSTFVGMFLLLGHCTAANGKIVLLREALNVLAAADGMFPNGISDVVNKKK